MPQVYLARDPNLGDDSAGPGQGRATSASHLPSRSRSPIAFWEITLTQITLTHNRHYPIIGGDLQCTAVEAI